MMATSSSSGIEDHKGNMKKFCTIIDQMNICLIPFFMAYDLFTSAASVSSNIVLGSGAFCI